jgi:hypothetical protein
MIQNKTDLRGLGILLEGLMPGTELPVRVFLSLALVMGLRISEVMSLILQEGPQSPTGQATDPGTESGVPITLRLRPQPTIRHVTTAARTREIPINLQSNASLTPVRKGDNDDSEN